MHKITIPPQIKQGGTLPIYCDPATPKLSAVLYEKPRLEERTITDVMGNIRQFKEWVGDPIQVEKENSLQEGVKVDGIIHLELFSDGKPLDRGIYLVKVYARDMNNYHSTEVSNIVEVI